jgi:stalled ribosome rescue protein Dom34
MSDAAVWIDHEQAKVFTISRESATEWKLHPHDRHVHLHHKAGKGDAGRAPEDEHYFHSVAEAVKGANEILIAGPGTAKTELLHHLQRHDPQVAKKVVGVEPLDHPSDGELLKIARKFFKGAERMNAPPR